MPEFEDIKEYYNFRYGEDKERHYRPLGSYKKYLRYLKVRSGERIIDVGCGNGYFLKNAQEAGLDIYGLDIAPTAIKQARKFIPDATLLISTGENLPFKEKAFNYVTFLGTLEHFLDPKKGLSEACRVTDHAAKFCIIVPNVIHYRLDRNARWGIKKIVGTKQQEMHELLMDLRGWKMLLKSSGLQIIKIYKDKYFIKKKNPLLNLAFYLWLTFLPLRYSYQFIFVCQKNNKKQDKRSALLRADKLAQKSKSYPKLIFYRLKHD